MWAILVSMRKHGWPAPAPVEHRGYVDENDSQKVNINSVHSHIMYVTSQNVTTGMEKETRVCTIDSIKHEYVHLESCINPNICLHRLHAVCVYN